MKAKIAILGGGPVAAYVYRACLDSGFNPTILSKEITSAPAGAFWLRWLPDPLEELAVKSSIQVTPIGSKEIYQIKQWGENGRFLPCSFPDEAYKSEGYDPRIAIPLLWGNVASATPFVYENDAQIMSLATEYDLVLQTFPSNESLELNRQYVVKVPTKTCSHSYDRNFVFYNGDPGAIVRVSILFGCIHYEYSTKVPATEIDPTGHFMDMHPNVREWSYRPRNNVHYIGRFAQWKRHMLAHEAYTSTKEILKENWT
jgi:hypothetical protein